MLDDIMMKEVIMRKLYILITFLCCILIGCNNSAKVDYKVAKDEEFQGKQAEVVEPIEVEDDQFHLHVNAVQDLINVFDVEKEHDLLYKDIKNALIYLTDKDEKKLKLTEIVSNHMNTVKETIINDYVFEQFGRVDSDFVERLSLKIDNSGIINIAVEYEWFYYQRDK